MLNSTIDHTNNAELLKAYQAISQENQLLRSRLEQYAEAYNTLQHQVKELLRHRFGSKSERFTDLDNPQGDLFAHAQEEQLKLDALKKSEEQATTEVSSHRRKKRKSFKDLDLPVRVEIIPVKEGQCYGTCLQPPLRCNKLVKSSLLF